MGTRFFLGAFVIFLLLLCVTPSYAHSSLYYDIVNDFNAGKNYYAILDIDKDATENEIRKNFRRLSVTLHPDKVGKQGEQAYLDMVRAYDVLRDPESRKEYEQLLREGVPWQDQYYGRYAHKYGAPVTDVRYVILGLLGFVSLVQYFNQYYKHIMYTDAAKKTFRYQQALKVMQHEKKLKQQQKKNNKKNVSKHQEEDEEEEDAPEVIIHGAEKPQVRDVIAVKLVLLPFYTARAIYRIGVWASQGFPKLEVDEDELARERMGMDEDEWEMEKAKAEANRQKMLDSNRYKRYKRWLKKNG